MANMHLVTGYAGAAHITAADQASMYAALFGTGEYVLDRGNKLSASVVTNNQIRVLDGDLLMQGRHVRLSSGNYVDLTIENGAQGYNRNDLIVARYTRSASTGTEECNLIVIKGTATTGTASDPAHTDGDLLGGNDATADMPLYRVPLSGLTVGNLEPLFSVATPALPDGSVTSAKIADGAVTSAKISGALPISKGGTDANTASGARTKLGIPTITVGTAAPSGGSNGDIYFQITT